MRNIYQLRRYSSSKNSFFTTTPIYYVNASPHIGHLYSSVIADAINRWQHLYHPLRENRFITGTDEHGSKIQQAALMHKKSEREYCTDISNKYKSLSTKFDINYSDFIRTTEDRHKTAVHKFWTTIHEKGHIYLAKYGGWYCVSDENFLSEQEVVERVSANGEKTLISTESGHPVEWTEEENYLFKLSKFQDDLKNWLIRSENAIKPKKFYKILLDSVTKESLPDISVSRPCARVHWGIKVPTDDTQTIYVWLDALVNYLTGAGYPQMEDEKFKKTWPPDVQVIGKDILKFHGIYWPAFLMAADLELPKTILCHSHWTVNGEKMSKSKNNVICPNQVSESYTTDGLRYFLLREGVAHSDGNYSEEKLRRILNSELADTFGNLLNRCCGQALNPEQTFPSVDSRVFNDLTSRVDVAKKLVESLRSLPDICYKHYEEYNFYKVVDSTILTLHTANLFFETMKPWELRKNPQLKNKLEVALHLAMESLRISAIILSPIVPNLAQRVLDKLNIPKEKRFWSNTEKLLHDDPSFEKSNLASEKFTLFKRIMIPQKEPKKMKKIKL